MKTDNTPAWMDKLAEGIDAALDASGIDKDEHGAAIFIAVQRKGDEQKAVSYAVRGADLPLAEAIGTLVYNRDLPEVLHAAAGVALTMRRKEDKARILRAARGTQRPKTHKHKPQNKKRK